VTSFDTETRHYCRNPRCRSKLPAPVVNAREAFCVRGCHSSFYLKRCLVCEGPIERKAGNQKVCRRSKCRSAFRSGISLGRYYPTGHVKLTSESADFIDSKQALETGPPWRVVAGPDLTPLHCASVPDGPDCRWEGSEYERIEKRNRAVLAAHFDKLDAAAVARDFCAACGRKDDLADRKMMPGDRWENDLPWLSHRARVSPCGCAAPSAANTG
jgi:hypothetical protein